MTPELTTVMMFLSLLILLISFPIAFCIRRFGRLARVISTMTAMGNHVSTLWRQIAVTAAIACVFAAGQVLANGTDPTVVNGQASFSTQGSTLSITNSPGTIINWLGFSIGASETTRFIQQSATSSVLNRVTGPDPSVILGTLTSNGRVFLINPSGILVGQGARIDVAGLVASTLNLSNQDFLAGRHNFASNPLAGKVENQGSITTPSGGSVYLVGSDITNSGIINSPQGDVILAAGQSVKIFDSSTPGIRVEITASDNAAVNLGKILAQSGEVGIYGAALRNTGIINADQVVRDASGKIVLRAKQDVTLEAGSLLSANGEKAGEITVQSETGATLVSGTIEAKGTGEGQSGGTVRVLGDKVGLITASIDASGTAGGGNVLVGGDYQGKNPSVQNASATYVSQDSTINADAVNNGNGGKIILWSNDSTRAYGSITARGGAQSGDGGLIETSGHWLDVSGINVNAGAPNGKGGTWLLDPADVTITGAVDGGGSFSGVNPKVFSPDPAASTANVNVTTIVDTLTAGTDVTVTTASTGGGGGNISVDVAFAWTVTAPTTQSTLTLIAVQDVNVNQAITATRGSFVANAGRDVNVKAVITTTDGDIVLRADNDGTGPGVAGGTVAFTGSGSVTMTRGAASIYYNPSSYAAPTDYSSYFTLTDSTLTPYMWVFAQGNDKVYDGLTTASLSFVGDPTTGGAVILNPGIADFENKNAGTGKTVTYNGYSLGGGDANKFALYYGDVPGAGSTTADITPAALGIAANNATRLYGDANPAFSATYTGFQNGETAEALTGALALATPAIPTSNVGNYAIIPSGQSSTNYTIAYVNGKLSVTPVSLMVTADAKSKVYGTSDPALTFSVTGLVNNPTLGIADTADSVLSGALTRAIGDPAICKCIACLNGETVMGGPYAITQGTLAANSNYTLGFTGNDLIITPTALNVAANPQNKIFGTSDPALTFSVTGLVNNPTLGIADTADSVLSGALTRVPGESALGGPYAITQGTLTAKCNYTLGFTHSNLVITDAAEESILGFNAGQVLFAGVINNETYYRPGNFWHISLNPNNADPGFDVMRGTNDLNSRLNRGLNRYDSVFEGGFYETWSFPQQFENVDEY